MTNQKYVDIIYNPKIKPFTNYPSKLVHYLIDRYLLTRGASLLELGCGRGEFLKEFINRGMIGYGVDISVYAKSYCEEAQIVTCDLTKEKLPYQDNYFDIIYSKSFIEHFYYPEIIFEEAYRVLKPGGIIITLTPEWNYIYKSFYEDYSHRTPFTKVSLKDIHLISNFNNVEVESFKQLPLLWDQKNNTKTILMKFLKILLKLSSFLTRVLIPDYFRLKIKWVRFSKELMLLSTANK
jgi:SAM-dependent methyltransferase